MNLDDHSDSFDLAAGALLWQSLIFLATILLLNLFYLLCLNGIPKCFGSISLCRSYKSDVHTVDFFNVIELGKMSCSSIPIEVDYHLLDRFHGKSHLRLQ